MREDREKWMKLCSQAVDEEDPQKMAALILEINCILEAKERRLLEISRPSSLGAASTTSQSKSS
jgi:hypothetical protein